MTHKTDSFKTADGMTIHTEAWLPDGDPKAVVLLVHGLAEYAGRYMHVAERMNAAGYAVYGIDHRGHGHSDGVRAYFDDFNHVVDDLKTYFEQVKAANPGKKIFVYGHSLGSLMALTFIFGHQRELAGAIISGTPLEVEAFQPKLLVQAGNLLNTILPKLPVTPLPAAGLSHDPAVVQKYDNDPLVHRGNVRVRIGYYIIHISRAIKARLGDLTLPLLIVHGVDDPICPNLGSITLQSGAGSSDKKLKMYDNMFHEIHNEVEKDKVIADFIAWLDQH